MEPAPGLFNLNVRLMTNETSQDADNKRVAVIVEETESGDEMRSHKAFTEKFNASDDEDSDDEEFHTISTDKRVWALIDTNHRRFGECAVVGKERTIKPRRDCRVPTQNAVRDNYRPSIQRLLEQMEERFANGYDPSQIFHVQRQPPKKLDGEVHPTIRAKWITRTRETKGFMDMSISAYITSKSEPQVFWGYRGMMVSWFNKIIDQAIFKIPGEDNKWLATLTFWTHNYAFTHSYYVVAENDQGIECLYLPYPGKQITQPLGEPFAMLTSNGLNILCGIQLEHKHPTENVHWFRHPDFNVPIDVPKLSEHADFPSNCFYALMQVPRMTCYDPVAIFRCEVFNEQTDICYPFTMNLSENELKPSIFRKPKLYGNFYKHENGNKVTGCFHIIVKYTSSFTCHATSWHHYGALKNRNYVLSNFKESRVRTGPLNYYDLFTFDIQCLTDKFDAYNTLRLSFQIKDLNLIISDVYELHFAEIASSTVPKVHLSLATEQYIFSQIHNIKPHE